MVPRQWELDSGHCLRSRLSEEDLVAGSSAASANATASGRCATTGITVTRAAAGDEDQDQSEDVRRHCSIVLIAGLIGLAAVLVVAVGATLILLARYVLRCKHRLRKRVVLRSVLLLQHVQHSKTEVDTCRTANEGREKRGGARDLRKLRSFQTVPGRNGRTQSLLLRAAIK